MVLQQKNQVRIWGTAANYETVTIEFNRQRKSTIAENGSWTITLDPMDAGGPYTMTIKGQNSVMLSDIYVGEVWHCAGQSNMDTRVSYYPHYKSVMNSTSLPMLRYLTIRQPGEVTNNVWETCTTPEKIGRLSALGFFFGKEILQALENNIAVGLIVTAVGGTTIASWLDPITVADDPQIKQIDSAAASMYKAWVQPVQGYAFRGTLWMHGEQDRLNGLYKYYHQRLNQLIHGWRRIWNIGDFPFYIVQLANYGSVQTDPNETVGSAVIREAQRLGLAINNTTLTVLIDIGDSLHFSNKQEAGRRLALPARALIYGEKQLVYSGPLFIRKIIEGSKIHCLFIHCGSGMKPSSGNKLTGFAIAGKDNNYSWADAVIHGDTVTVSNSSVAEPVNVRYAYGANPIGNLVNSEGLPASPFTTEGAQLPFDTSETAIINLLGSAGKTTDKLNNKQTPGRLTIFSLNGKKIFDKSYDSRIDKNELNLILRGMKSGVYIIYGLTGDYEQGRKNNSVLINYFR
jgi:sialate O-acetylesterase